METPNVPEWKTKFFYSLGSVHQIREGSLEKVFLEENLNRRAFKEMMNHNPEIASVPKVIGIYQDSYIFNETQKVKEEREIAETYMIEAESYLFESIFNKKDICAHDLISLVYNPENWPNPGIIKTFLGDISERIAITPVEKLPDFYEKDIVEFIDCMPDKNPDTISPKELDEMIKVQSVKSKKLIAKWKKFGMTLSEYITMLDFNPPSGSVF